MSGMFQGIIGNVTWDLATSDLVMAIAAALFVACLLIGHLPLIGRLIPAVKPYTVAAALLAYGLLAYLALCVGYRIADERAELRRLRTELAWKANQLKQQKATADDAERIAQEKAAEAEELKGKVSDYEKALEAAAAANPQSACALTDDDIARLRALSKRPRKR